MSMKLKLTKEELKEILQAFNLYDQKAVKALKSKVKNSKPLTKEDLNILVEVMQDHLECEKLFCVLKPEQIKLFKRIRKIAQE